MENIFDQFRKTGIIPVVVLNEAKDAPALAKALCAGGLPCAEVTFRTSAAADAIRAMNQTEPKMLVGAGTVLSREQVDKAVDAGAEFIVSPGFDKDVVCYCMEKNIPITPGVQTASEMLQAINMGLDVVKFFPAESIGGLKTIKAVAAALTSLSFMPTGGINAQNVRDYLAYDRIIACGGSWMVKQALVEQGKLDEIRAMASECAAIVKEIRG